MMFGIDEIEDENNQELDYQINDYRARKLVVCKVAWMKLSKEIESYDENTGQTFTQYITEEP